MASVSQPPLPVFDSKSEAPDLFNGTPRLYISLGCPYAQRVWIARNFKGLQNVELVAIDLADKPKWYLEKVYPPGKVPSLEHDGKVKGESLELLEYLDQNFEGTNIFPQTSFKKEIASDLLKYSDKFNKQIFAVLRDKEASKEHAEETIGLSLDYLENTFDKFSEEGSFFLGQISVVDFAYAPFIERYHILIPEIFHFDIFEGNPHLRRWYEALNKVDAYTSTKTDRNVLISRYKTMLGRV